eukprot:8715147-Alexandrium_andersonii.AAC.1
MLGDGRVLRGGGKTKRRGGNFGKQGGVATGLLGNGLATPPNGPNGAWRGQGLSLIHISEPTRLALI